MAVSGDDENPGTLDAPKATVNAGISAAKAEGKTQVYISEGTYNERVALEAGISLYGGYSEKAGWARSSAYTAVLQSNAALDGYVSAMVGLAESKWFVDRDTVAGMAVAGNSVVATPWMA